VSDEAQPPDLRASDAERDATIERLRDAAGEGRLTLEELTDRIEDAAQARTRGELDSLVRDLPAVGTTTATTPVARPLLPAAPVKQTSVFGDVRRSGQWLVPAQGSWQTVFGDVVLDLREARIPAAELHVRAGTVFGDIDLLVPEGVEVEVRAGTVFGDVRQEAGDATAPSAPRILLTGGTVFGDVKVRHERLRERLVARWRER
jgi:hypothetical protein